MGRPGRPVVFVHGLWKSVAIWDRWIERFTDAGYRPVALLWPGERSSSVESRRHPEDFAHVSFDDAVGHFELAIMDLDEAPIFIGHSFGALIAERMLAFGLATAAVAIDPAQFDTALPGSIERLRQADANWGEDAFDEGVFTMTPEQFGASFAENASDEELPRYYDRYAIPSSVQPLLDVATEGFRLIDFPASQAGPLLLVPASRTAPGVADVLDPSIVAFRDSISVEQINAFVGRGNALVFDDNWESVADAVLDWLEQKGLQL